MSENVTKEFNLIGLLEDTGKKIDEDMIGLKARKEMLKEIIEFIKTNDLKVTKEVPVEIAEKLEK